MKATKSYMFKSKDLIGQLVKAIFDKLVARQRISVNSILFVRSDGLGDEFTNRWKTCNSCKVIKHRTHHSTRKMEIICDLVIKIERNLQHKSIVPNTNATKFYQVENPYSFSMIAFCNLYHVELS